MVRWSWLSLVAVTACAPAGTWESDMQLAQADEVFAVVDGVFCDAGDWQCNGAANHRAATARQTQVQLRSERRQAQRDQRTHGLLVDIRNAQQTGPVGFWCFEGQHDGSAFGQCHPQREACLMLMGRRIEAGLKGAMDCERFEQAACFSIRRSLKRGSEQYCFPTSQHCGDSHSVAVTRDFEAVTACDIAD